jgi:hypothetical protein
MLLAHLALAWLWRRTHRSQQVALPGTSHAALLHAVVKHPGEDSSKAGVPLARFPCSMARRRVPGCMLHMLGILRPRCAQRVLGVHPVQAIGLDAFEEGSKDLQDQGRLSAQAALQSDA